MKPEQAAERSEIPSPPSRSKQISKGSFTADYISHGLVTDRLLSVDPSYVFEPLRDDRGFPIVVTEGLQRGDTVGVWARLVVLGAEVTEFCSGSNLLDAYSRCLCRAAMRRGVALDLWINDDGSNRSAGEASVGDATGGALPSPRAPQSPAEFSLPKSWAEVQDALKPYGQETVDDFNAFGVQAREYLYPGVEKLASNESTILRQHTAKAVKLIRDSWAVDAFPPPPRWLMREAWKAALELPEDLDLEGPPWRMGPDESEREERA